MLEHNLIEIGNRLYEARRKNRMTQAQAAEAAGLSDRTYADIERGTVNMRIETFLRICEAFKITPDDILVNEPPDLPNQEETLSMLDRCTAKEKKTAIKILGLYLRSLEE